MECLVAHDQVPFCRAIGKELELPEGLGFEDGKVDGTDTSVNSRGHQEHTQSGERDRTTLGSGISDDKGRGVGVKDDTKSTS